MPRGFLLYVNFGTLYARTLCLVVFLVYLCIQSCTVWYEWPVFGRAKRRVYAAETKIICQANPQTITHYNINNNCLKNMASTRFFHGYTYVLWPLAVRYAAIASNRVCSPIKRKPIKHFYLLRRFYCQVLESRSNYTDIYRNATRKTAYLSSIKKKRLFLRVNRKKKK